MSADEPSVRPDDADAAAAAGDAGGPPPAPLTGAPYFVPWGVMDAVGVIALYLFLAITADLAFAQLVLPRLDSAYADPLRLAVAAFVLVVAVAVWLTARNRGWLRHLLGSRAFTGRDLLWAVVFGIGVWAVLIVGLGNVITWLVQERGGELPPVQENLTEFARDPRSAPILVLSACLLAPIGEEMFFRGMVFPALRKRLGSWPAIGLSGLLFGLVHFQSTGGAYLLTVTIIFPVGMALARLYEWRPTLLAPIFAHAVYNSIQIAVLLNSPTA